MLWRKTIERCVASSPTVADGIVYQAFMQPRCHGAWPAPADSWSPGRQERSCAVAIRHRRGRVVAARRRANAVLRILRRRLYALQLRGRKRPRIRWTFTAEDRIVAAPAYRQRKDLRGHEQRERLRPQRAHGRKLWHATSFSRFGRREYFYATPAWLTAASSPPTPTARSTRSARRAGTCSGRASVGTYVYTAPALWRRKVYVGTWDGNFIALDAARARSAGATKLRRRSPVPRPSSPVSSTSPPAGAAGRRHRGGSSSARSGTFALNARNGQQGLVVFRRQVLADRRPTAGALYLIGRDKLYALIPRGRWRAAQAAAGRREAARR